jgi:uncharacterized membrane protein (UPF0136 family)
MNSIYILAIYGTLLFLGGIIGFVKSGSKPSIIMGSLSALALAFCIWAIKKEKKEGYFFATAISGLLSLFFTYRFYLTGALMPAGLMATLSWTVLAYLILVQSGSCKK